MFTLKVAHYPTPSLSYVWIKVSGQRFDSRSRSASPSIAARDDGGWGRDEPNDTRTLPESVILYAVPKYIRKSDAWVYRTAILDRPYAVFKEHFMRESQGREPIYLAELQMGHRYAEKDVG